MEPITKQNIGETTAILYYVTSSDPLELVVDNTRIFKHTYEKVESGLILGKIFLIIHVNYSIHA